MLLLNNLKLKGIKKGNGLKKENLKMVGGLRNEHNYFKRNNALSFKRN